MKTQILLGIMIVVALSSCSSTRIAKGELHTIKLKAEDRIYTVKADENGHFRVISEVPPDVAVASITNITNSLIGKIPQGEINANSAVQITESITSLGKRTVAVNILRDALYRLEEYNLNNQKIDATTQSLFREILSIAKDIALAEIRTEETKQKESDNQVKITQEKEKTRQLNEFNTLLNSDVIKGNKDSNLVSPILKEAIEKLNK